MVNLLTLLYGSLAPLSPCGPTVRRPGQKSEDQPNSCSPGLPVSKFFIPTIYFFSLTAHSSLAVLSAFLL